MFEDESAGQLISGENGIRIVWPFATRSCGDCLKRLSIKVSYNAKILDFRVLALNVSRNLTS